MPFLLQEQLPNFLLQPFVQPQDMFLVICSGQADFADGQLVISL